MKTKKYKYSHLYLRVINNVEQSEKYEVLQLINLVNKFKEKDKFTYIKLIGEPQKKYQRWL